MMSAVAGDEGQALLHDLQPPEAGKLVQHQQQAVLVVRLGPSLYELQAVGQQPDDHVDQDPHQRP